MVMSTPFLTPVSSQIALTPYLFLSPCKAERSVIHRAIHQLGASVVTGTVLVVAN